MTPGPGQLGAFAAVSLLLLLTPGPAVLYIVARGLERGRRAGLVAAAGLATGGLVHVSAAAVGATAALAASPVAFAALRFGGAAYLIYLGVIELAGRPAAAAAPRAASRRRIYADGILVSLLNPKAAVFFLAFLPQFADPARGPLAPQLLVLGAIFLALALVTDSAYALLAGSIGEALRSRAGAPRLLRYAAGSAYLALAAAVLLVRGAG
jgi:threonine/homoserine/homoserine lactone efflux protein